MTKEKLGAEFKGLDREDQEYVLQLMEQMIRAKGLGLAVHFDEHAGAFFLADAAANCVIAPPPMNLATVTAWLDDYEKEAAAE